MAGAGPALERLRADRPRAVPGQRPFNAPFNSGKDATAISQAFTINLATGSATAVPVGRSVTYRDAGIGPNLLTGSGWGNLGWDNSNLYGPAILAATAIQPAGVGGLSYTRLDGDDPATGHIVWRGPWAGDLYVLRETFTGPPVNIAQSCAPSGLAADPQMLPYQDAHCDGGRLYAINV